MTCLLLHAGLAATGRSRVMMWLLLCPALQIRLKTSGVDLLAWMKDAERGAHMASSSSRLQVAAKAILAAGTKSLTHLSTYVERYQLLLQTLLQEAGPEVRSLPLPCPSHVAAAAVHMLQCLSAWL